MKSYISPGDPSMPGNGMHNGARGGHQLRRQLVRLRCGGDPNGNGNSSSQASIPSTFLDGQSDTIVFAEWYTACGTGNGNGRIWSEDGQGSYGGDWDEPSFWLTGGSTPVSFNFSNPVYLPLPQFRPAIRRAMARCFRLRTPAASWWDWATAASASSAQVWATQPGRYAIYPNDGQPRLRLVSRSPTIGILRAPRPDGTGRPSPFRPIRPSR